MNLEYNIETMRITDPGEAMDASNGFIKKPNVYEQIKAKSTVNSNENIDQETGEIGKVTADVQTAKLKQLLGAIKTNG